MKIKEWLLTPIRKLQRNITLRAIKVFGEAQGMIFVRCLGCQKALAYKDPLIHNGCPYCKHRKFSPAKLTLVEEHKFIWRMLREPVYQQ